MDVVRVQLLSSAGVGEAAEVRIGHMEVSAAVPVGGLDCALTADDGVTWTVTGSDPQADQLSDTQIVWNDVGPIEPGGEDSLDLPEVRVPTAAAPPALPRTGCGALVGLAGLALIGAAGALWRKRR